MGVYFNDQPYDGEEVGHLAYIDTINRTVGTITQEPVWCESISLLETYIKCHYKGLTRETWKFGIDTLPYGVLTDLFPSNEIITVSDINGNKYALTKGQYVAATNSGTAYIERTNLFDYSIDSCMAMLEFIRSRDVQRIICNINMRYRIRTYVDFDRPEFDPFTLGAMTKGIQKYRIYPVERRSNAILCQNDNKPIL